MLLRSLFISAFLTVALLGNAGTHTVQEWFGVCNHSSSETVDSSTQSASHAHCSHGHHHHHGDQSHHDSAKDGSSEQLPVGSSHEADNCLVCQFFSLSAEQTAVVELPSLIFTVTYDALPACEGDRQGVDTAFDRRGPPALG
ncbi:MAG: hypothetical protein CMJ46_05595 [Planctomyces sp.]|nr:hypothetical protein [Planctomyces sp.]